MKKRSITEIQKEYMKIDKKWLRLHFNISFGMVLFSIFIETVIGILVCNSDLLSASIPVYLIKFLVTPAFINLLLILIDFKIINSKKLADKTKIYCVSLIFSLMCFVIFTVHIYFNTVYLIFILAIILTTIYADYKLTITTSVTSLFLLIISQLFIKWDVDKISIFSSTEKMASFIIAIFIIFAFTFVCMVIVFFEKEKNLVGVKKELEKQNLLEKLKLDELTGVFNRNAFHDELSKMINDSTDNSYVFVMIDIDNFKIINDNHGHYTGDQCLISFSELLIEHCQDALPFRYGGDEFCILFKNVTIPDITRICEKIQEDFNNHHIAKVKEIQLSASFGIAPFKKTMSVSKLLFNTDKALYHAKNTKNSIQIYSD